MPRSPAPKSRVSLGATRHPDAEAAILAAAAELLEERGYRGFSLDEVVKRASSSKPTIYRRWRNKAALIMEVYERAGEAALTPPDTGDLARDLEQQLVALWTWWSGSKAGEAMRSFVTEAQLEPESVAILRDTFVPNRERSLRAIFTRAQARGDLKPGADVDAAVALLMGLSWLRLLTDQLEDLSVIGPAVAMITAGLATAR